MSASFRRVTALAVESPAATYHISRRVSSSIGVLRINKLRGVGGGGGAVLRSSRWVIEAVGQKGGQEEEEKSGPPQPQPQPQPQHFCSFDRLQPYHEVEAVAERGGEGLDRRVEVMVAVAATVVLGVGNRVLYKLALVPLKHYPFFLAQLATLGLSVKRKADQFTRAEYIETEQLEQFVLEQLRKELRARSGITDQLGDQLGKTSSEQSCSTYDIGLQKYVLVYFSILYFRYQAGKVTDEMLSLPKFPLIAVGFLEALAAASGMAAGAILSGAAIPILSQSFLVWQLALSYIFLGRRYSFKQLFGCFLVAVGVIVTVASGSGAGSLMEAGLFWSIIMIISFLLQAADSVLKETIFLEAAHRLKGGSVDLFVVNSFGSAYQVDVLSGPKVYVTPRCNGAPLLPLLFIIVNMGFNISLLHLLKISSAVVSCLASTFSVPISVYLFTLPLPYLGVASSLPPGFVAGGIILAMGLVIYTWTPSLNLSSKPVSLINPRTE
ncbi:crt1 [Dorcoceras hygrometricum]|uniref:Crt1 n=1 Tax=Dorcoceras hygrometricum TaxID=472368 RepID=A0A2Z7B4T2_9LAMI|nr:crt1 [Dorcoceras hygrometricum]